MKNKCFERKIRKLDRNSKEDSICFNCSNGYLFKDNS